MVFDSLWKTFDGRFQTILESLRKHRDLIDQEANAINISEARAWRSKELEYIREWRVERNEKIDRAEHVHQSTQVREATLWVGADEEQEEILARLSRTSNSTDDHWVTKNPMILSWLESSRGHSVVWLNGKPGGGEPVFTFSVLFLCCAINKDAPSCRLYPSLVVLLTDSTYAGKSVICSKLIEHIQTQSKPDTIVMFHFFRQISQGSEKQMVEVLRSFVVQLLQGKNGLAQYILETFANQGKRPTTKNLGIILEKIIGSFLSVRIVVDGLDECGQDAQDEVMENLLKIKGPAPGSCKILLSSRNIPRIGKRLQSKPTLCLDDNIDQVESTISSFVHSQLTTLRDKFNPEIVNELEHQILTKANGEPIQWFTAAYSPANG